jgi:hypothetical protein
MGFDATKPIGVPFRERADILGTPYDAIDVSEYVVAAADPAPAPWRSGSRIGLGA